MGLMIPAVLWARTRSKASSLASWDRALRHARRRGCGNLSSSSSPRSPREPPRHRATDWATALSGGFPATSRKISPPTTFGVCETRRPRRSAEAGRQPHPAFTGQTSTLVTGHRRSITAPAVQIDSRSAAISTPARSALPEDSLPLRHLSPLEYDAARRRPSTRRARPGSFRSDTVLVAKFSGSDGVTDLNRDHL